MSGALPSTVLASAVIPEFALRTAAGLTMLRALHPSGSREVFVTITSGWNPAHRAPRTAHRAISVAVVSLLASSGPLRAQTTHRLFTELEATWGHSMPGPITATPDGDYMLVAEAGVLAIIDTAVPSSYQAPRLDPIGSVAVRAVDLLLDPAATLHDEEIDELDIVYVAGGRLGLRAMQAHPTDGEARAVRLDDAIDASDLAGQSSERWCNDLATIVIASQPYLLALFADANSNRVRAYRLSALRSAVDAGVSADEEFGHELAAAVDVTVDANSAFQPQTELPSFGLGMAVDGLRVYVALGQQGIVRITYSNSSSPTASVLPGPFFGDLSSYASQCNGLYGDFEYTDGQEVIFSHAPYFMDVAVERINQNTCYLWAAVDHLGLVRFLISNPSVWNSSLAIKHQEGEVVILSNGRRIIQLFDDPNVEAPAVQRQYAHELRIAETSAGLAMAVSISNDPFLRSNGLRAEGRALDHLGEELPHPGGGPLLEGKEVYTALYHLPDMPDPGQTCGDDQDNVHVRAYLREGARGLHLQQDPPPEAPEALVVYGGWATSPVKLPEESTGNHTTFRAEFEDWPDTDDPPSVDRRLAADRPGRIPHDIGYSPTDPRILYTGSNDDQLPPDGILVHCADGITRYYDPPGSDGVDERGTFGILWNPYAIWEKEGAGLDYAFGVGKPAPPNEIPPRWMLVALDPGANLCPSATEEPERLRRAFFDSPPDRFESIGRGYFSGAAVSLDYDLANEPSPARPIAFCSRIDTPDGVVVMDRSILESLLQSAPDGSIHDPTSVGAYIGTLDTHPEFANIVDPDDLTDLDDNFIVDQGLRGLVQTFFPYVFELSDPEGPPAPDHWMAAVPCMSVQLPDDLDVFDVRLSWLPDQVYIDHFDHSMVRVFDVQNLDPIEDPDDDPISYTLLGPRPGTSAYRLETVVRQVEGIPRTYLFVIDFGGGIVVWDLTDLRGENERVIKPDDSDYAAWFFEEWRSPDGAWDEFENNVWGMAIDQATWNDGEVGRNEVYVYALVARVGIEVLRFLPENPAGQRLEWVKRIETPFGFGGLRLRQDLQGVRTLLVSEAQAGLRIFGYGQ